MPTPWRLWGVAVNHVSAGKIYSLQDFGYNRLLVSSERPLHGVVFSSLGGPNMKLRGRNDSCPGDSSRSGRLRAARALPSQPLPSAATRAAGSPSTAEPKRVIGPAVAGFFLSAA